MTAWAQKIHVTPREIHVRSMIHKWGSVSTTGRVSFSSDLLRQHPDFRNRVIVEELLHLNIPSHGNLFTSLLKTYLKA